LEGEERAGGDHRPGTLNVGRENFNNPKSSICNLTEMAKGFKEDTLARNLKKQNLGAVEICSKKALEK